LNAIFEITSACQSNVDRGNSPFAIDQESGGQRIHAAVALPRSGFGRSRHQRIFGRALPTAGPLGFIEKPGG